jgi:uncharacterized heparinase superfamily protein
MLIAAQNIGRMVRTLAHLKPIQVINRLSRNIVTSPNVFGPTPELRFTSKLYAPCPCRPASMIGRRSFLFLGQKGSLGEPPLWNAAEYSKLWLYNLHYFDDLLAEHSEQRSDWHISLISNWIAENPPTHGVGWEPYVVSRRSVNWIGWHLSGSTLTAEALESLAMQARSLSRSLEYHLLGNHLFSNAKALIFLGSFFQGREAEKWRKIGLSVLSRELDEQILADGGHFELSPMYHALTLEDLIDLIQLASIYPDILAEQVEIQRWCERAQAMLQWLYTMSHPDGDISFFNDASLGQTRNYLQLKSYFFNVDTASARQSQVQLPTRHLPQSGYARLQRGPWVVLMDMAEVGASYLPGHAHADTLSVEISFRDQRLVTNGGTSVYAPGQLRELERSTASHATMCVDEKNSSEIWASFRVGRRAQVLNPKLSCSIDSDVAEAAHDGYRYLKGRPLHSRKVFVSAGKVAIYDTLRSKSRHRLTGRLPLHPSVVSVTQNSWGWDIVTAGGYKVRAMISGPVELGVEDGFYAQSFGLRLPRRVLTWRAREVSVLNVKVEFSF